MGWGWLYPMRAFGSRTASSGTLGSRPLLRRIGRALSTARRQQCGCLLFRLQLSGLDALQQQHGEAFVEGVSRVIAERVRRQIRGEDLVTRIGGEEFALLAQGVEGSLYSAGERIAERITESLVKPYGVDSVQFTLGLRIGIAGFPDNATNAAGLLLAASQALHTARRLDHDGWRFSSTLMDTSNRPRRAEGI
ncbi:MAG TPA: GGDEF domain-containing protein [Rhodanobacteraceae bacterium]|nr:GGDEF domain-containing protein [Rhodanobacteraceae bacterium]